MFSIKVAEIENLLCAEDIVKSVAQRLGQNPDKAFADAQQRCWHSYAKDRETQTGMRARAAITFALCGYGSSGLTLPCLVKSLQEHKDGIAAETAFRAAELEMQDVFDSTKYDELLRTYNNKGLISMVAVALGMNPTSYTTVALSVLSRLRSENPFPLQRFIPDGLAA